MGGSTTSQTSHGQDVMGTAVVSMRPGKKMDHQGVGLKTCQIVWVPVGTVWRRFCLNGLCSTFCFLFKRLFVNFLLFDGVSIYSWWWGDCVYTSCFWWLVLFSKKKCLSGIEECLQSLQRVMCTAPVIWYVWILSWVYWDVHEFFLYQTSQLVYTP